MRSSSRPIPSVDRLDDAEIAARDAAWLAKMREGDRKAFEALFRCYSDPLCGFVFGYTRSIDEAQEIVQDLFCWLWEHRAEWNVTRSVRTYLFQAAHNRALNRLKRRRMIERYQERAAREVPEHATDDAADATAARELADALGRAVAELPDRCREVFTLNRWHNMSYAQIAAALGISAKTVENHMGRALTILRKRLADWR
ncbi:MAG: RNA polymerase sigma-70 factor [Gemmatimonadaceae bacterium]|nr:RNA polymerase sigma-70 factor [Gemmatimonadaceae bacterium]